VKTSFLRGDLEKGIYKEHSDGFVVEDKKDYVCRLRKNLYDFNQVQKLMVQEI